MQTGRANKKYHCLDKLFIHTLTNLNGLTAITHYLSRENMWLHWNISSHLWHTPLCGCAVCAFLTKDMSQTLEMCTCMPASIWHLQYLQKFSFHEICIISKREQWNLRRNSWFPSMPFSVTADTRCCPEEGADGFGWVTSCFLLPASK